MIIKLIVFAIGTAGIIFISFHSAGKLRSYGLIRFFTFESILALILINVDHWFRDPFSIAQIISWIILIACVVMVSSGFYMLRRLGKSEHVIDDTRVLVTSGIYRYIRHPLYGSLVLLAVGAFLKDISPVSIALTLAACILSVAIARVEEKEDVRKFGEKYLSYMRETKMFIPFVI
ncbi:methyltransferase family protein [Chloroflexota bacterium]